MYYERKGSLRKFVVNTDDQRRILFPSDYNGNRFKINVDISFHVLKDKFKYDFFVVMNYLERIWMFIASFQNAVSKLD